MDQLHRQDPLAEDGERLGRLDEMELEPRHEAGRRLRVIVVEDVRERGADDGLGIVGAVDRHGTAEQAGQLPQIVQAEEVVGMIVGIEDGVDGRVAVA